MKNRLIDLVSADQMIAICGGENKQDPMVW